VKGYFKRDKENGMELESSQNLPENALEWAAVLREVDSKFSYRFVNT
jgi:hypothetical protein